MCSKLVTGGLAKACSLFVITSWQQLGCWPYLIMGRCKRTVEKMIVLTEQRGSDQLGEPKTSSIDDITQLAPLSRIAAFCYAQHCMQTQLPCYAA